MWLLQFYISGESGRLPSRSFRFFWLFSQKTHSTQFMAPLFAACLMHSLFVFCVQHTYFVTDAILCYENYNWYKLLLLTLKLLTKKKVDISQWRQLACRKTEVCLQEPEAKVNLGHKLLLQVWSGHWFLSGFSSFRCSFGFCTFNVFLEDYFQTVLHFIQCFVF